MSLVLKSSNYIFFKQWTSFLLLYLLMHIFCAFVCNQLMLSLSAILSFFCCNKIFIVYCYIKPGKSHIC